ncbi:MAG: hypothetical protein IIU68_02215, partial [Bacteroidales bacterium]|nr:hypothetical protein [Bacteroidales bacterium]
AFEVLLAEANAAQAEVEEEIEAAPARKNKADADDFAGKAAKIGGSVLAAAASAAITSVTRSMGTAAANAVTGKKSKSTSGKSIANKAITNATSSALRTLTRSILGNLIK